MGQPSYKDLTDETLYRQCMAQSIWTPRLYRQPPPAVGRLPCRVHEPIAPPCHAITPKSYEEKQVDDMAKPGQKGYDACACSGCGMLACRCRFTNKAEVSQPMSPSNSYFECPGCIDCGGKVSYNECSACRNWCARCPACNHARWVFKECPACSDGLPADVRALLSNFSW